MVLYCTLYTEHWTMYIVHFFHKIFLPILHPVCRTIFSHNFPKNYTQIVHPIFIQTFPPNCVIQLLQQFFSHNFNTQFVNTFSKLVEHFFKTFSTYTPLKFCFFLLYFVYYILYTVSLVQRYTHKQDGVLIVRLTLQVHQVTSFLKPSVPVANIVRQTKERGEGQR